ncbi:uncharacterized protein F4812DRAFT_439630 [Daldinia caldariorum]|uniref:uncharacterized protein n=1 Tax=Daldinia caldariorum TaxID=326644 RepID=UPI0020072747|nr:uncharacterized protein F4812DRAFT_439630 [Daldinia caldariorum]KAI1465118.1 hypothetical protein F4812DRAFT_439630 [Daldinia caldariorum]
MSKILVSLLAGISSRLLVTRGHRAFTTYSAFPLQRNLVRRIHSIRSISSIATNMASADEPSESDPIASSSEPKDTTAVPGAGQNQATKQEKEEKKLPPLKGAEFRAKSKSKSSSRGGRSIINDGLAFVSQLEMHHSIEETYIFPVLARRMPEFRTDGKGGKNAAELLRQHEEIHKGMEGMQKYLRSCRDGEQDLDMATLKSQMETWGTVLWTHLDQEVTTLGAENMRKYWTAEEIRRIPM